MPGATLTAVSNSDSYREVSTNVYGQANGYNTSMEVGFDAAQEVNGGRNRALIDFDASGLTADLTITAAALTARQLGATSSFSVAAGSAAVASTNGDPSALWNNSSGADATATAGVVLGNCVFTFSTAALFRYLEGMCGVAGPITLGLKKATSENTGAHTTFTGIDTIAPTLGLTYTTPAVTFAITVTQTANGTISPGTTAVRQWRSQAFTVTPATGYHIASLTVDGAGQTVTDPTGMTVTFSDVAATHTLTATYAINTYIVSGNVAAGSGTVTPSGNQTVNQGSNITFAIAANAGNHIASMTVDGTPVTVASSYTFTNVTAGHTLAVTFAAGNPVVTASSGANGAVAPSGATAVVAGASQAYTITPSGGYGVLDVLVDGVSVGAVTGYTFTNAQFDHTISATFVATGAGSSPTTNQGVTNAMLPQVMRQHHPHRH